MDDGLGQRSSGPVYRFGRHEYEVGARYSYQELPSEVKKDVLRQEDEIESRFGRDPKTLHYRLIIVPHADLIRQLEDRFGEERFERKLREASVRALAERIEKEGLRTPPVLEEGLKRALAIALLGWDMPYFTADEPLEMPVPSYIPTLDGRWPERAFH